MPEPVFIAIVATSLDGKIAPNENARSDWSSPEDKKFLRTTLDQSDLVFIGRKTYELYEQQLAKRKCLVLSDQGSGGADKIKVISGNLIYCGGKSQPKKYIIEQGFAKVAVLGGAQTYSYCLHNSMLDEIYLTIEPLTFETGTGIFTPATEDQSEMLKWQLLSAEKINPDGAVLLHYKR